MKVSINGEKNNIEKNITTEKIILINLHSHNAFIADSLFFSNKTNCKYWNVEKVPKTDALAINNEKTPKLAGWYNLNSSGVKAIPINWDIELPVNSWCC